MLGKCEANHRPSGSVANLPGCRWCCFVFLDVLVLNDGIAVVGKINNRSSGSIGSLPNDIPGMAFLWSCMSRLRWPRWNRSGAVRSTVLRLHLDRFPERSACARMVASGAPLMGDCRGSRNLK